MPGEPVSANKKKVSIVFNYCAFQGLRVMKLECRFALSVTAGFVLLLKNSLGLILVCKGA